MNLFFESLDPMRSPLEFWILWWLAYYKRDSFPERPKRGLIYLSIRDTHEDIPSGSFSNEALVIFLER